MGSLGAPNLRITRLVAEAPAEHPNIISDAAHNVLSALLQLPLAVIIELLRAAEAHSLPVLYVHQG